MISYDYAGPPSVVDLKRRAVKFFNMSMEGSDDLNNAVKADDDGACHDPDYLSPAASASSSEFNVGESSTEDEANLASDSGDEPNLDEEDMFNDPAVAQGARISCAEEDDVECEDHFEELNSFAMASQGNIHTLAVFPRPGYGNTGYNLLVATLSRQVYTMGFVEYDPQKRKMEDLRFVLPSMTMKLRVALCVLVLKRNSLSPQKPRILGTTDKNFY